VAGSLRYQNIPQIKMIVVLGELGGTDEYGVVEALKAGAITKPVVSAGKAQHLALVAHFELKPSSCCCHTASWLKGLHNRACLLLSREQSHEACCATLLL
jgi:succinyl-CoA synthetase alpha subunit